MNPPTLDDHDRQQQPQVSAGNDAKDHDDIHNHKSYEEEETTSGDYLEAQDQKMAAVNPLDTNGKTTTDFTESKEEVETNCHLKVVAMTSKSTQASVPPQAQEEEHAEAEIESQPTMATIQSDGAITEASEAASHPLHQLEEGCASSPLATLDSSSTPTTDHLDAQTAARVARQDWQAKSDEQTAAEIARQDWQAKVAPGAVAVSGNSFTRLSYSSREQEHPQQPQPDACEQDHDNNPTETTSYNSHDNIFIGSRSNNTPIIPQHDQQEANNETLLEATLVEHHPNHDNSLIITKAVEAEVVEAVVCGFSKSQLLYLGGCLFCLLGAMAVAVSWAVITEKDNNDGDPYLGDMVTMAPTPSPRPTLQQIRDRDVLRCGVWGQATGFFTLVGAYEAPEDQVDYILCRAYAAAILGDPDKHEIVKTSREDNLEQLHNKSVDLLVSHVETGMETDTWESARGIDAGFTFSTPYVYADLVYGGLPEYVACAENNTYARGNCSGLRICTNDKSAYYEIISKTLIESHIVKYDNTLSIILGFTGGYCNVMPSENSGIMEWGLSVMGYRGPFVRGKVPFSKDVGTVATRDDDVEFSDFINIILLGLIAAEQANITRENAADMQSAHVLGIELANAVSAVGSYKDVYERGVAPVLKRGRWNVINNGTTGLLYSLPLGRVRNMGPGPTQGGTLERIWGRSDRKLHCGIRTGRPGFADWDGRDSGRLVGLDVEFCTALAASILEGYAYAIRFVPVLDEEDGYAKLQKGEVDVLAGFTWNVVNDYREPSTGEGYTFSLPYFYWPVDNQAWLNSSIAFDDGENRCLVTRQDDPQFSSFVYWAVSAIVYAEEKGITQARANEMPDVNLFGGDFLKMFRDAVYYFGNYKEGFERNLGNVLPERGRNAVNKVESPGPQIYVPPGFF